MSLISEAADRIRYKTGNGDYESVLFDFANEIEKRVLAGVTSQWDIIDTIKAIFNQIREGE